MVLAAQSYLQFVATRQLTYSKLTRNFLAVGLSHKIRRLREQRTVEGDIDLVDAILESSAEPISKKASSVIDGKSNLGPRVFRQILMAVGFERSFIDPGEEAMLKTRLLRNRNAVAHGRRIEIDVGGPDYVDLHKRVVALMDRFRDAVLDAATRKEYLEK